MMQRRKIYEAKKDFTASFYRQGAAVSRLQETLQGNSLILIIKSPGVPGTHLINIRWIKG